MFAWRDGRHPDEVVGPGEERGERGGERDVPADGQADRGGDELLLGDIHLEVPLGMRLGELLQVRGVVHLPVQGGDAAAGADRGQRLAEGQPGGDLGAQLVAGQAHLAVGPGPGRSALGPQAGDHYVTFAAELEDGALGHLRGQRPAAPALAVLDLGEPVALAGAGQDYGGRSAAGRAGEKRLVDLAEVVPVDDDGVAAERLHPLGVRVQAPAQFGRAALAEAVHVDDRGEVAQVVVGGLVQGLPDRPLGHLAVPAQHPDPVRQFVEVPAGQGHPDPVRQPLAERAGGHVDPRQHRGGVALQP